MNKKVFNQYCLLSIALMITAIFSGTLWPQNSTDAENFELVIVGGTPGGIMAAVASARCGHTSVILERNDHIGGLPANGLGNADIQTRGVTYGLFAEFIHRIKHYYIDQYGINSKQVEDCKRGYRFEPHAAESVFEQMLAEHENKIAVRKMRQFNALPKNVVLKKGAITEILVTNRQTQKKERYKGKIFIDATYEGDLSAAAGVSYRLGREGYNNFYEPMAGRVYKPWRYQCVSPRTTFLGDNGIQAYNYRLCLTKDEDNKVPISKPDHYNRSDYVSLIEDIKHNRLTGKRSKEIEFEGIGRVVNLRWLPNGKADANNQHLSFVSTDLPEENWPWPTAGWEWRDQFAKRLKNYTLGLLWFVQHDPDLPEDFRQRCLEWGLAKDEFVNNEHFPRQVYVREGRRIEGEHLFTAHDALPVEEGSRPPIFSDSITASHYALNSHAVRKREPGHVHLDGFYTYPTQPYTVPYGVIVPQKVNGLLTPVPVSGTHVGFSTLRMEPCWMALGQAAGVAASISIENDTPPRYIDIVKLQQRLLKQKAVLIYFEDAHPDDKHFEALQFFTLRGFFQISKWEARLNEPIRNGVGMKWIKWAGCSFPDDYVSGKTTRGELLQFLYDRIHKMPPERISAIQGGWLQNL